MKKRLYRNSLLIACFLAVNTYGQHLGKDKLVSNSNVQQLNAPDMAIAFNGWIYNAYRSGDSITVKRSKDQGRSWQLLTSLSGAGDRYTAPAIVVTGATEEELMLFVAGIKYNALSAMHTLFVAKYNAMDGALVARPFSITTADPVYSCDLAASTAIPGSDAGNISLLYAAGTGGTDRIIQMVSTDKGNSFPVSNTVAVSQEHYRNVSICYGRSTSASNGRYFMAWDEYSDAAATAGKIYTSRNASTVISTAITPVRIDNAFPATAGRLRHPVIAVSTTADNEMASCTAVILSEYEHDGAVSIAGYYNKKAHFTNRWKKCTPGNTDGTQPAIAFDAVHNAFVASYYNKEDQSIRLMRTDFRMTTPAGWKPVASNYADHAALSDPQAGIAIDPVNGQAALSWAAAVSGQAICFDAEFNDAPERLQVALIKAENKGRYNKVYWSSNEETEGGVFVLERSADGDHFEPVAHIPAQEQPSSYSYMDPSPVAGMNHYRIGLNAGPGIAGYSGVATAFMDLAGQQQLTLYPNPATDRIRIQLSRPPADATAWLTIYDLTGKTCKKIALQASGASIDISDLAAGSYSLSYNDADTRNTVRFVKTSK